MTKILLCFALVLGSCSQTVDMTTLSKSAYTAKSAYEATLVLAVAYNERPRCTTPKTVVTCSEQAVVDQLRRASAAADAATQAAENAVRSLGSNPTIVAASVTAAEQSVKALQAITSVYGGK